MDLDSFAVELRAQVLAAREVEEQEDFAENAFVSGFLSHLADAGEIDDAEIVHYRAHGAKLNAYVLDVDAESLDLVRTESGAGLFVLAPSPRDNASSPLWRMKVVVGANVTDPLVMDTSGVQLYVGAASFDADVIAVDSVAKDFVFQLRLVNPWHPARRECATAPALPHRRRYSRIWTHTACRVPSSPHATTSASSRTCRPPPSPAPSPSPSPSTSRSRACCSTPPS